MFSDLVCSEINNCCFQTNIHWLPAFPRRGDNFRKGTQLGIHFSITKTAEINHFIKLQTVGNLLPFSFGLENYMWVNLRNILGENKGEILAHLYTVWAN